MLETYRIGVTLEMGGNVQTGIDRLMANMERLQGRINDVNAGLRRLVEGVDALGAAGRNVSSLSRALGQLNTGRGVESFDRMAASARAMTTASEQLTAVLRTNAELASATARAVSTAARATGRGGSGAGGGRSHGAGGFGGHDWALAGAGASMLGDPLLHGTESALDRAMEIAHLRTQILADRRVSPAQADTMVQRAYDATTTAPGTRVAGNLHALIDLKQVTGSLEEAEALLPRFARMSALLQVIDRQRGGSGDPAFAAAKAMELLGGMVDERQVNGHTVRDINGDLLQKRLDMMSRVAVATNGRVSPQDYLGFAKQARVAGMTLSDEFVYERLPAVMLGMGGAKAGTALMSMAQVFRGGKLSVESMEELHKLGLAGAGGITTKGRKKTVHGDAIFDYGMLGTDPDKWVEAAQKRMEAAGLHGTQAQIDALMRASQRSTIAGVLAQLLKDQPSIQKEAENIRATKLDSFDHFAANDPIAKMQQMTASFDKLLTTLAGPATQDAVMLMDKVTGGLNALSDWARNNPTTARVMFDAAAGLGAVASAVGVLSTAIFVFGPALKLLGIGGGAAGGAAAGAGEAAGAATRGGWLGAVSRAAGLAGLGTIAGGVALVGGALYAGGTTDPVEAEKKLRNLSRQRRYDPMQKPVDGYGDGSLGPNRGPTPIQLRGDLNVDGKKMGEYAAQSIARSAGGPRTGAIGANLSLNPWMIPTGM